MNTQPSDERIQAWQAGTNPLERATLVLERTLDASPETVFPLLCPTREYDWIPTWECELLHSESGVAEHNAIFRTRIHGMEETWVCTLYDPSREIHYVRMAAGLCTKLEISLSDPGNGKTNIRWALSASALVEEMNEAVADLEAGGTRIHVLEHLLDDLEHYLGTGEMRV